MNPDLYILISLLSPLLGALLCLPLRGNAKRSAIIAIASTLVSLLGAILLIVHTANGDVLTIHAGSWPAPYGIVVVADAFSSILLAVCQAVVAAALIFCSRSLGVYYHRRHLYPLVLTLSLGANGAFLTGDLFNLYVWFEVLLLSSFALMAMIRGREAKNAAWRYVVINLVSSLLFLSAAGLIYGKTGTLNFAELKLRFLEEEYSFLIKSSAALLFGSFGIKSALIPLAFWLPCSYPKLPPALSALFAGILTKVGLYAFYRVFGMVFSNGEIFPHKDILYIVALVTMLGGVLGAISQGSMRGILSFHIISQVGYMILALALFTPLTIAAGIFYLVHHIIVKANLFLVTSLVEKHTGSSDLTEVNSVLRSSPIITLLFAIPALSLAGLPPLSGFFAKFALLKYSITIEEWLAAAAISIVGILTLFSMLKIWRAIFWGESDGVTFKPNSGLLATSACLAIVTIAIGFYAEPMFQLSKQAAYSLVHSDNYIDAVLNKKKH